MLDDRPGWARGPGWSSRRRALVAGLLAVLVLVLAATLVTSHGPVRPPSAGSPGSAGSSTTGPVQPVPPRPPSLSASGVRSVLFGASADTRAEIELQEQQLGRRLGGVRIFRRWGEPMLDADSRWAAQGGRTLVLSVRSITAAGQVITFAQVAAARPGSPQYQQMVEQADQLRSLDRDVWVSFDHEPDANPQLGTARQFGAAWRTWAQVMRERAGPRVHLLWITTGFGYTREDARRAPTYWPGDRWVDAIGVDVYNFAGCASPAGTAASDSWQSMADLLAPALRFTRQRPQLPVMVAEYSSVEDPQDPTAKARWVQQAAELVATPGYAQVVAMLQWSGRQRGEQFRQSGGCNLDLASSPAALRAFRAMGAMPAYQARAMPTVVPGAQADPAG